MHEEEVFYEEGLDGSQDATRATLFLKDRILHLLVEVEALGPRRVETSLLVTEEKCFEARCLLRCQIGCLTASQTTTG